jgi:hypothetical protein
MKGNKVFGVLGVLMAVTMFATFVARAQDTPAVAQKKLIALKVLVVFEELEGTKKIASLPYTFRVLAGDRMGIGGQASIRDGLKVPVSTGSTNAFQYMDVGANMDCRANYQEDGSYRLNLSVQRTFLFTPDELKPAMDMNKATLGVGGNPVVQTFSSSYDLLMHDGQTIEATTVTNPLNGRVLKVFVTINLEK